MFGVREDLIVPLGGLNREKMLEFWHWLLPGSLHPWFATAIGDLFLRDDKGQVWWLDVGSGQLQAVAHDEAHFRELLADPENANLWLGETLVDVLRESGLKLGPGEVYSYQILPILGGEYAPGNFCIYDILTHFQVWGPIHEKLKDLPDGASVEFVVE